MKTFNIWGSIKIDIDFDVEAETEDQATKKAIEEIKDFYHLDSTGSVPHSTSRNNVNTHSLYVDEMNDDANT